MNKMKENTTSTKYIRKADSSAWSQPVNSAPAKEHVRIKLKKIYDKQAVHSMSCDAHRAQIGGAFWGRLSGKCSPPKGGKSEENVQRYVRRNFQGGECAYGYWL